MEKIVFEEAGIKKDNTAVVRVSKENHDKILEISDRTSLPARMVSDKLLAFALERVEWEKL